MKIYQIKVNGYVTYCHVGAKTIIGAINRAVNGLNVTLDDILEVKRLFRELKEVEFKTKN